VKNVGLLYAEEGSVILKGAEANEAAIKKHAGDVSILHLATHAVLDDANPMYSRLAFGAAHGSDEDGWLEAWEIARMNLSADVAVLSACETARGATGSGEGVIGMAWSFLLAGARSTVATQWKVASATTARLMVGFHRSLQSDGADPAMRSAAALRKAQLDVLHDRATRHPFYWASFMVMGDLTGPRRPAPRVLATRP
jgi:CHAT domain-containing protein